MSRPPRTRTKGEGCPEATPHLVAYLCSMKMTVLGGCGAWPAAGQACSGYLVEHDGFRLLVDPGYATLPRLLEQLNADEVDAVFVSHGHPDHCVDLNPLLRPRARPQRPERPRLSPSAPRTPR